MAKEREAIAQIELTLDSGKITACMRIQNFAGRLNCLETCCFSYDRFCRTALGGLGSVLKSGERGAGHGTMSLRS
jgi:hypothetical protein